MLKPIERAWVVLQGLSVGDAFGGHFEFEFVDPERPKRTAQVRQIPKGRWRYTDDTLMALSIYDVLRQDAAIVPEHLADSFATRFDIGRGYGASMEELLQAIRAGGDWKTLSQSLFDGSGSFGNGSAMRVAPIGGYFADDLQAVVHHSRQSSLVTHTHPQAIDGAITIALATAIAHQLAHSQQQPMFDNYWQPLLNLIPSGEIKQKLIQASELQDQTSPEAAATLLGNGRDISALDSVPFAVWCTYQFLDSYEDALWNAISVGGDADTIGAMVGGIVASYGGLKDIPSEWLTRRETLPNWIKD